MLLGSHWGYQGLGFKVSINGVPIPHNQESESLPASVTRPQGSFCQTMYTNQYCLVARALHKSALAGKLQQDTQTPR